LSDLAGQKPKDDFKNTLKMMEIWSTVSETGVRGDPTSSTAEKGNAVLEAAIGEFVQTIDEFAERLIKVPQDHH
jgi:creatinine amidohydrolase